jgi:hypothetical protein
MSDALITPLSLTLPHTMDGRTQDKHQVTPQEIPVTVASVIGEFVKVKAEMHGSFTIPQFEVAGNWGEFIRPPIVVGSKGHASAADYYLGGMTGLGGGTADYRDRGNLTTHVFRAVSQKNFPTNTHRNTQASLISGPQGAVINDAQQKTTIVVNGTVITSAIGTTITIYSDANKVYINPPPGMIVYLGGDGNSGTYDFVLTASSVSINVKARIS